MENFVDPLTLSRIKDLPLVANRTAQGFLHGLHRSIQRGTGIEFSQYRSYEPGDPLTRIDWKLFARSDRYFVREAQRESDTDLYLVFDSSASMEQQGSAKGAHPQWRKFDFARYFLATLGCVAQQQGDRVGMLSLSGQSPHFVPAQSGSQHWKKLLLQMAKLDCQGSVPDSAILQSQLSRMRRHGIILVLSDFYQQQDELLEMMGQLVSPRTDVIALHVVNNDEQQFPFEGQIRFEDRETHQQVLVNAKQARKSYLQAWQRFEQELQQQLLTRQIQYHQINMDQPLDTSVLGFLHARLRGR